MLRSMSNCHMSKTTHYNVHTASPNLILLSQVLTPWQVWEVFAALPPKDAPHDFDYNGAGGTATLKKFSYRRRLQVWTILPALAPNRDTSNLMQFREHLCTQMSQC
jgi:hypothetical protein